MGTKESQKCNKEQFIDQLEPYLQLTTGEIGRLVLLLLVEEGLQRRLSSFRKDFPPEPIKGLKELLVVRSDVMPVGDRPG
jgi:hypothetical protein